MGEKWLARELELNQKHEEILMRREALLRGTEAYYDTQDQRQASFIASFAKAKERNTQLLQDFSHALKEVRHDMQDPGTPKFNTLKNNYWAMVRNVFPVWYDDYKDYEARRKGQHSARSGSSRTPMSQRSRSPRTPRTPQVVIREPHEMTPERPASRTPRILKTEGAVETRNVEGQHGPVPPLDLDFSVGTTMSSVTQSRK